MTLTFVRVGSSTLPDRVKEELEGEYHLATVVSREPKGEGKCTVKLFWKFGGNINEELVTTEDILMDEEWTEVNGQLLRSQTTVFVQHSGKTIANAQLQHDRNGPIVDTDGKVLLTWESWGRGKDRVAKVCTSDVYVGTRTHAVHSPENRARGLRPNPQAAAVASPGATVSSPTLPIVQPRTKKRTKKRMKRGATGVDASLISSGVAGKRTASSSQNGAVSAGREEKDTKKRKEGGSSGNDDSGRGTRAKASKFTGKDLKVIEEGDPTGITKNTSCRLYKAWNAKSRYTSLTILGGVPSEKPEGAVVGHAGDSEIGDNAMFLDTRAAWMSEEGTVVDASGMDVKKLAREWVKHGPGQNTYCVAVIPTDGQIRVSVGFDGEGGTVEGVICCGEAYRFTCAERDVMSKKHGRCNAQLCLLHNHNGGRHVITPEGGGTAKVSVVCWELLNNERKLVGNRAASKLMETYPFKIGDQMYWPCDNVGSGWCFFIAILMHVMVAGYMVGSDMVLTDLGWKFFGMLKDFVPEGEEVKEESSGAYREFAKEMLLPAMFQYVADNRQNDGDEESVLARIAVRYAHELAQPEQQDADDDSASQDPSEEGAKSNVTATGDGVIARDTAPSADTAYEAGASVAEVEEEEEEEEEKTEGDKFLDEQLANLRRMIRGEGDTEYPSFIWARVLSPMLGFNICAYNASFKQVDATNEWNKDENGEILGYPKSFQNTCAIFLHVANEPFALDGGRDGHRPNHWLYLRHSGSVESHKIEHGCDDPIMYDGTALSLKRMKEDFMAQGRRGPQET